METQQTGEGQVTIKELEAIGLPLRGIEATLACAADDKSRHYNLRAVYLHSTGDEYRLIGTDGVRLLVYSSPIGEGPAPAWTEAGVAIATEGLKERVGLLRRLKCETARVAYQTEAPQIVLSNREEDVVFKLRPLDAEFLQYQRILDDLKAFKARKVSEMSSTAFDARYLKGVGDLAKLLDSNTVQVFDGGAEGEPTLVAFPGCEFAVLVLMPLKEQPRLGAGAARILEGAVNGTVAALRAHRTRWATRLEDPQLSAAARKAAENKIADYDRRIAAIIEKATAPALPPPEEPSYAIADAVAEGAEGSAEYSALDRSRLSNGKRAKLYERFCADLNAVLSSEHGGLTLSQLVEGVPVEDWFDANLSAAEAASRCLDWRRAESPLPAEEPPAPAKPARKKPGARGATRAGTPRSNTSRGAPKRDFEAFRRQVSAIIEGRKGLALDDLPDCPIRDWFDAGVSAKAAAGKAIAFAKSI
ncbi:MAG TPA: hypothetical protein VM755_00115 [Stellaceae bacterium]|nr:hypothetical protein [Stellaceae bacterium]